MDTTEEEVKALTVARMFCETLVVPSHHLHQVTVDICQEIVTGSFPRSEDVGAMRYRIDVILEVCHQDLVDYYVLAALRSILNRLA